MSLLEVEDIWTAYGPIVVNRGVSIAVDEGEIVTIIGSNGAGKSTLLKTIAGLKRPKSGTIRFSDKDVTGTYADGIARCGVVLVPEGRRIFPDLTVRDNLRLGGYSRTDSEGVEKDIGVMESFFPILAERRSAKGSALSGGQQQMLAIARGLMAKPKILILDEPSLGLAPIIVHEVRSIILSVRDKFGAAVLLVEQNASLALAVADRGYIMQNGRIVAEGAIEELRSLDLVRETYLGNRQGAPDRLAASQGRLHDRGATAQYGGAFFARCALAASTHHERSSAKPTKACSRCFPSSPIGSPLSDKVLEIGPTDSELDTTIIPISDNMPCQAVAACAPAKRPPE